MEKDFGIRFTDEVYATKDDVKKAMNISSIDSIWDKIIQFRAYYTRQMDLKNIERVPFNVVLPPKITAKIVSLEKKLSKALVKYSKDFYQQRKMMEIFTNNDYTSILKVIANVYGINIYTETLNSIVNETSATVPVEYLLLSHYSKALKYISKRSSGPFTESFIVNLYCKLRGIEFDPNDIDSNYRTTELVKRGDHVFVGQHYEAAPVNRIKELVLSLVDFLNSSELFGIVKATTAYFYIKYIQPFEYYNEEMAILVFKSVLANDDLEAIPSLLRIEELLTSDFVNNLKYLSLESEMNLDLTYLLNYIIDFTLDKIEELEDDLEQVDSQLIYDESRQIDVPRNDEVVINTPTPKVVEEPVRYSDDRPVSSNVNFNQQVSLPNIPVGLDEADAEIVADHLLELYPSMKRNQAEFYARHCTIGKYYTISQYKKEMNVVYETARTSMENLVLLGLYRKEPLKNKFVYTPVVKNDK